VKLLNTISVRSCYRLCSTHCRTEPIAVNAKPFETVSWLRACDTRARGLNRQDVSKCVVGLYGHNDIALRRRHRQHHRVLCSSRRYLKYPAVDACTDCCGTYISDTELALVLVNSRLFYTFVCEFLLADNRSIDCHVVSG